MKKVAYVTRTFDKGPQGELHGGSSVMKYLQELYPTIEHVEISGTYYLGDFEIPELRDMSATRNIRDMDFSKFDVILLNDWGFAPAFMMTSKLADKVYLMTHFLWNFDDGMAHWLEKFAAFGQRFIAPTQESYGILRGRFPEAEVTYMPYPVSETHFHDGDVKHRQVVWVGRDDHQKDVPFLYKIAEQLPKETFILFSGTEMTQENFEHPENVVVRVGENAWETIRGSTVQLMTSRYELYATTLIEGGLSGCRLVARDVWGVRHCVPFIRLGEHPSEIAHLVKWHLDDAEKDGDLEAQTAFFQAFYGSSASSALDRWDWFMEANL